eukprot:3023394-Prymnesium_polylepis.1
MKLATSQRTRCCCYPVQTKRAMRGQSPVPRWRSLARRTTRRGPHTTQSPHHARSRRRLTRTGCDQTCEHEHNGALECATRATGLKPTAGLARSHAQIVSSLGNHDNHALELGLQLDLAAEAGGGPRVEGQVEHVLLRLCRPAHRLEPRGFHVHVARRARHHATARALEVLREQLRALALARLGDHLER